MPHPSAAPSVQGLCYCCTRRAQVQPNGAAAGQHAGQAWQRSCPGLSDVDPEVGRKSQASGSLLPSAGTAALAHPGGAVSDHYLSRSDGEAPGGNPMVAGFQDDLDLDDKIPSRPMLTAERVPSKNITLSSEEEEEEEVKDSKVVLIPDEDVSSEQEKKRYKEQPEV